MARRSANKKILVIDDNPDVLASVKERFHHHHLSCQTAETSALGLKKALQWEPDLILLDLCLPKMSGFGLLREMKKNPKLHHIPVIILSGISDEEVVRGGMEMGAAAYISKTCSAKELVAAVQGYL